MHLKSCLIYTDLIRKLPSSVSGRSKPLPFNIWNKSQRNRKQNSQKVILNMLCDPKLHVDSHLIVQKKKKKKVQTSYMQLICRMDLDAFLLVHPLWLHTHVDKALRKLGCFAAEMIIYDASAEVPAGKKNSTDQHQNQHIDTTYAGLAAGFGAGLCWVVQQWKTNHVSVCPYFLLLCSP